MAGKFEDQPKKDVHVVGEQHDAKGDNLGNARLPDAGDTKGFKFSDAQLKSIQDGIKETEKALAQSFQSIGQSLAALSRPDSTGNTVDGKKEIQDWAKAMGDKVDPRLVAMATGDKNAKA